MLKKHYALSHKTQSIKIQQLMSQQALQRDHITLILYLLILRFYSLHTKLSMVELWYTFLNLWPLVCQSAPLDHPVSQSLQREIFSVKDLILPHPRLVNSDFTYLYISYFLLTCSHLIIFSLSYDFVTWTYTYLTIFLLLLWCSGFWLIYQCELFNAIFFQISQQTLNICRTSDQQAHTNVLPRCNVNGQSLKRQLKY